MVTLPAYGLSSTVTNANRQDVPGRFAPAIPAIAETLSTDGREDPADDQRESVPANFRADLDTARSGGRAHMRMGARFALDLPNSAFARLFHEASPPHMDGALAGRATAAYRRPLEAAFDGGGLARRVSLAV